MAEQDLELIRDRLLDYVRDAGCCAAGVCNMEGLESGPPSTDLTRELAGARSAVVFAYPLDEEKLELYMGKIDHAAYQHDYILSNNATQGISGEVVNQLRKFGYETSVVYAGNTPADGEPRDVMPQNERQRTGAELNPLKPSDAVLSTRTLILPRTEDDVDRDSSKPGELNHVRFLRIPRRAQPIFHAR